MSYMSKCEVYKRDLQTGKLMSDNLIEVIFSILFHLLTLPLLYRYDIPNLDEHISTFSFDRK